jgi:MoxR-like ATPase
MLKLKLDYPTEQEERAFLDRYSSAKGLRQRRFNFAGFGRIQKSVDEIYVDEKVKINIVSIVFAQKTEKYNLKELKIL